MADLDMKEEQNKQLIKLISEKDIESIEEEVEFKVFKLAKSLKRKKITKSSSSSRLAKRPCRVITIAFHRNSHPAPIFSFDVKACCSVDELIQQVQSKRNVRKK